MKHIFHWLLNLYTTE